MGSIARDALLVPEKNLERWATPETAGAAAAAANRVQAIAVAISMPSLQPLYLMNSQTYGGKGKARWMLARQDCRRELASREEELERG